LSGKRLFDPGPAMGNALDWAMTTERGERMAHGVFAHPFSDVVLQDLTPERSRESGWRSTETCNRR
jgi:hypothetical protein